MVPFLCPACLRTFLNSFREWRLTARLAGCMLLFLTLTQSLHAQNFLDPVTFYGIDLTHFEIVDKKIPRGKPEFLVTFFQKFQINKKTATDFPNYINSPEAKYHPEPALARNKNLDLKVKILPTATPFPKEQLEKEIREYELPDSTGQGMIIFFHSGNKSLNQFKGYLVLFDVASRQITAVDTAKIHMSGIFGKITDYTDPFKKIYATLLANYGHKVATARWESSHPKKNFRPTIFRYSTDELPVSFDFGLSFGLSSEAISTSLSTTIDVYHILAGFRWMKSPAFSWGKHAYINQDFLFGYRYRQGKISLGIASGFGRMTNLCTSGLNSDCENYVEETISDVPFMIDFSYFPVQGFGISVSTQNAFSSKESVVSILFGIRFGLQRLKKDVKE